MKQKLSILFVLGALILSLAMTSAITFTQTTDTYNFTSTINDDLTSVSFNPATLVEGTYSYPFPTVIPSGSNALFYIYPNYDSLKTGKIYSTTATLVNDTAVNNETVAIEVIKSFCSAGSQNDTSLKFTVDISNNGEGKDDDWTLRDNVEVKVDFDNNFEDLNDIIIEFGLFDETGDNIASDLDWISKDDEQADVNDVDEGDSVKHTFEFVVPNDIDDVIYTLMVKVYPDGEEDNTCIDYDDSTKYYQNVKISRESDDEREIVLENIQVDTSQPIACGTEVTVTAKAYNIGTSGDQEAVKVNIYNKDLGVDLEQVIEDIDSDESANIEFTFEIPESAEEDAYVFNIWSQYGYDKDDDKDDDEVDFDDSSFSDSSDNYRLYLTVEGNCIGSIQNVDVDVALNEDTPKAIAGKEVILETTLKNTGDLETEYTVSVSGVSSWAETTIKNPKITLDAGESGIVTIVLDIDNDAELGYREDLALKVSFADKDVTQYVGLTIEEGGFFSSITGGSIGTHLKDNWFIYTIVIVDIILILAIVIAIKSMVTKRPTA